MMICIIEYFISRNMLKFEWNPAKEKANQRKHRVDFKEAATVFRDPMGITFYDPDHSGEESFYDRWVFHQR